MASFCFKCGKKRVLGQQHRHHPGVAGRQHYRKAPRTPKSFLPNLHSAFIIENGKNMKVKLCTKCRRLLKKQGKIRTWKKEEVKVVRPEVTARQEVTKGVEIEIKREVKEVKRGRKPKAKKEEKAKTISVEEIVGKKS